jgi:hypothetical protein
MAQPEHVEQDENPAAGLIGWAGMADSAAGPAQCMQATGARACRSALPVSLVRRSRVGSQGSVTTSKAGIWKIVDRGLSKASGQAPDRGVTWAFGAPRGIRTPNRQIRSLVLCVGLVGSRRI